jgi:hypothetical protein
MPPLTPGQPGPKQGEGGDEISPVSGRDLAKTAVGGAFLFLILLIFILIFSGVLGSKSIRIGDSDIRGDNPWLWLGATCLFAFLGLAAWFAHTYFWIYLRKKKKGDKGAGGANPPAEGGGPEAGGDEKRKRFSSRRRT